MYLQKKKDYFIFCYQFMQNLLFIDKFYSKIITLFKKNAQGFQILEGGHIMKNTFLGLFDYNSRGISGYTKPMLDLVVLHI